MVAPAHMSSDAIELELESLLPPLPITERGKTTILGSDINSKKVIYAHGKSVYIRNLSNEEIASAYSEHAHRTTLAKFSPSGYYVASAGILYPFGVEVICLDAAGNVRIWDVTQPEKVLKGEYRVLSGAINDLCWDFESRHLIVVGEGRDKFAHAFHFDTGSSIGEIIGHTKTINSVSIRPCRPIRAVTASDDFTVNFYTGTPYKFVKSIKNHSRFVQCVQYSPDGTMFASAGADGKVFVYDGESGETKLELVDGTAAHSSGVLALSWSPDSKQLLTSSMDQTSKIWDIQSGKLKKALNLKISPQPQDNQVVGNLWTKNGILSVFLSGKYVLVNEETGEITKEFGGHQKGLSALGETNDGQVLSASYDGQIYKWDIDKQSGQELTLGKSIHPENQIQHISTFSDGSLLVNSPFEDKLFVARSADCSSNFDILLSSGKFGAICSVEDDYFAGLSYKTVKIINRKTKATSSEVELPFILTSVTAHKNTIAIGSEDKQVFILQINNGVLSKDANKVLTANLGVITSLAFSPDGKYLAVGDDQRRIRLYLTDSWEPTKANWCHHSAKISSLKWTKDGRFLISAALDNAIMLWSPTKLIRPIATVLNAHAGPIVDLVCQANGRVVSASQDGSIRVWKVKG